MLSFCFYYAAKILLFAEMQEKSEIIFSAGNKSFFGGKLLFPAEKKVAEFYLSL